MQARDVMTTDVATISADTPVREIAALLLNRQISGVPVTDATGAVIGMVSEGDLMHRPDLGGGRHRAWWLRLFQSQDDDLRDYIKDHGMRAAEVMTRDVVSVAEDRPLSQIAEVLESHRIKRVPVVRDGKLVGIVSRADLLRGLAVRQPDLDYPRLPDDRALRAAVLEELAELNLDSSPYLGVVVSDGVVHIWGVAKSTEEIQALKVAAESVAGVRSTDVRVSRLPAWAFAE